MQCSHGLTAEANVLSWVVKNKREQYQQTTAKAVIRRNDVQSKCLDSLGGESFLAFFSLGGLMISFSFFMEVCRALTFSLASFAVSKGRGLISASGVQAYDAKALAARSFHAPTTFASSTTCVKASSACKPFFLPFSSNSIAACRPLPWAGQPSCRCWTGFCFAFALPS